MVKYLRQYKFSILLAGVIALLSLIPGSSMPDSSLFSIRFLDKILHFGMYGFFGFVALLELRCPGGCIAMKVLMLVSIFLMSLLIELLQATVIASRSSEWLDLAANLCGLCAGYISYRILLRIIF